jgi:hypothetical protein
MNTFDVAIKNKMLPATMEELVPLSFMGRAAVKAYTEKIKAMKELGIAEEQRAATLSDGQDAGEMLIRIETRIGEICSRLEKQPGKGGGGDPKKHLYSPKIEVEGTKKSKLKEMKLPITKARNYEIMNANPEAVEQAIAKAREDEEIPTASDVINIINTKNRQEKKKVDNEDKAKFKDINEQVLKTAEIINNLCNSLTLYTDHWDDISPKAKEKLGEAVEMFINIFKRLKKEKSTNSKKLLISNISEEEEE